MKRLRIDFGVRVRALPAFVRPLCVVLALGAAVPCGHAFATYRAAVDAWDLTLAGADVDPQAREPESSGQDRLADSLKQVTALRADFATPWEQLFLAIEAMPTDGIAVLEMSGNAGTRELVIRAEARDAGAMQVYVQKLGRTTGLSSVRLGSHEVRPDDAQYALRFSVMANWDHLGGHQ